MEEVVRLTLGTKCKWIYFCSSTAVVVLWVVRQKKSRTAKKNFLKGLGASTKKTQNQQ